MQGKCLCVTEGRCSNCVCCLVPHSQCDLCEFSLFFGSGKRDENLPCVYSQSQSQPMGFMFFVVWDQPDFLPRHLDYPTHKYKRCSKSDSITAREVSHLSLSLCACQAPAVQRLPCLCPSHPAQPSPPPSSHLCSPPIHSLSLGYLNSKQVHLKMQCPLGAMYYSF